ACCVFSGCPVRLELVLLDFFFQAEDGIRDFHVTGVQTCALPISNGLSSITSAGAPESRVPRRRARITLVVLRTRTSPGGTSVTRSEERRVGKEGRARGRASQEKKNGASAPHSTTRQEECRRVLV